MSLAKESIRTCLRNVKWNPQYPWEKVKTTITTAIKEDPDSVDVFEYEKWGYNALATSLLNFNDVEFARFLLKSQANPNIEISGVHSNKLIFFAKSVQTLELLKQYGADMKQFNKGQGTTRDMNLLHASLFHQVDEDVFDYLIEEGFDPHVKTMRGANLWHSLLWFSRYCPSDRLFRSGYKIKKYGISIHEGNPNDHYWYLSPLEYLDSMIHEEKKHHSESGFFHKFVELRRIMTE